MRLVARIRYTTDWRALLALTLAAAAASWWLAPAVSEWIPTVLSRPLIWLVPAAYALSSRDLRAQFSPLRGDMVLLGLLVGLLQVVVGMVAGVLFSFGHSPYPHDPLSILYYFPFVFGILAASEVIRWRISTSLGSRYGEALALFGGWGLLAATAFAPSTYLRLTEGATAFEWAGSVWLPMAAAGLFATYLALRAGPLASFAYLGIMTAFEWYFPILPSLPWPIQALVGVAVPVFGVALIEQSDIRNAGEAETEEGIAWGSIAGAFAIVAIIWFNAGVFGVRPAIVHGHSMEPTMHTGDMMLSEQVTVDELEVGDVIRFKVGSRVVLHRIIEITYDDQGQMIFITQGDNNSAADSPVYPEDIEGRMVAHIPKVGWPVVAFKRAISGLSSGEMSLSTLSLGLLALPVALTLASYIPFRRLLGMSGNERKEIEQPESMPTGLVGAELVSTGERQQSRMPGGDKLHPYNSADAVNSSTRWSSNSTTKTRTKRSRGPLVILSSLALLSAITTNRRNR